MTIAALYARVSTEEQGRKGYSLADQVSVCRQKLLTAGITEIEEYVDSGYSGEFLDRPALERLRNDLYQRKLQKVVVYDPDRLSRNLAHMLLLADEIKAAKADLEFITGSYDASPEGKLFFSMRGAIAQFEKDKIRERTLRGKKKKALSGKVVAYRARYGYDWDQTASNYVINEAEAAVVREIYEMCISGMGLHAIARKLNDQGIRNKHGNSFKFKYVYTILIDSLYSGTYYVFKEQWSKTGQREYSITKKPTSEWIGIPVPAIVSRETQEAARAALSGNKKHAKRNRSKTYLLTGLMKCKVCGHNMIALSTDKGKKYYVCNGKRRKQICPDTGWIPADLLEEEIWGKIVDLAKTNTPIASILKQTPVVDRSKEIAALVAREQKVKRRKADILGLLAKGLSEAADAEDALKMLNKELLEIAASILEIHAAAKRTTKKVNFSPAEILNAKTVQEKRRLLKNMGITWHVSIENRLKRYGKHLEIEWIQ